MGNIRCGDVIKARKKQQKKKKTNKNEQIPASAFEDDKDASLVSEPLLG